MRSGVCGFVYVLPLLLLRGNRYGANRLSAPVLQPFVWSIALCGIGLALAAVGFFPPQSRWRTFVYGWGFWMLGVAFAVSLR